MSNIQKRKEGGFTIIEVLIVLAIAGLIMLIVFLAVPALQRNSRNTQIKNAASSVLGAISEFENNNSGATPTAVAVASDGTVTVSSTVVGSTSSTAKIQGGYTISLGTAMPTTAGTLVVNIGNKCNGNAFGTVAAARAVSIGFAVENSSSTVAPQCVES